MNRTWLLLLLIAGCTEKATPVAPPDESKIQPLRGKPDPAPPQAPTNPAALVREPSRTLHPLGGTLCIERYTACTKVPGKPDDCKPVDFGIQCGETKRLPQTGELLTCGCP